MKKVQIILVFFLTYLIKMPLFSFDSWDFFDTLVARKLFHPHSHYELIEKDFPFPNFKQIRINAERCSLGDLDSIYQQFQKMTGITNSQCEMLKNYEIQTDLDNLFPILENFKNVKDGDIVVSDTYYSESQIMYFLKKLGCEKKIKLFVSINGKSSGVMWDNLTKLYGRDFRHTGDNYQSDIIMAEKYGIKANYFTKSFFNEFEKDLLIKLNNQSLIFLIRCLRLSNPYSEDQIESSVYMEQVSKNIPLLVLFSHALKKVIVEKGIDKILFSTRDCCHLSKIFKFLYPEVDSQEFHASRIIYMQPSQSYLEYINKICTPCTLIVDLQGSGQSICNFFENNFSYTPNLIYLVKSVNNSNLMKQSLNINFICSGHDIERYNYDLIGTLIDFQNDKPIRKQVEYDLHFVKIMHNCVDYFLKKFVSYFVVKHDEKDFLFFLKHSQRSSLLRSCINHEENH